MTKPIKPDYGTILKHRKGELAEWLFYNVVLGLSPVFISWFGLAYCSIYRFSASFLDGSIIVFAVTLSGASMSFYTEWRKVTTIDGKSHKFLYIGLITTIILGVAGYTSIILLRELAPTKLDHAFIGGSSLALLLAAAFFNLWLAACRLLAEDTDLQAIIADLGEKRVIAEARKQTQVDGVSL